MIYYFLSFVLLVFISIKFLFDFYKRYQKISTESSGIKSLFNSLKEDYNQLKISHKTLEENLTSEKILSSEYRAKYEALKQYSEEKIKYLEETDLQFKSSFKALSLEALEKNNINFLTLAKEALDKIQERSSNDLQKKKESIAELFNPLKESLGKMGESMLKLEKERKADQEGLKVKLAQMIDQEKELKQQTQALERALRTPHIRGRWGEIQLKRVVELSGMINHCDFIEQKHDIEEGKARPDMIICLPGNRHVIVDAKTPFEAYLDATQASDEETKISKLKTHAKHLRSHILGLGKKSYWEKFEQTPEFVVLFLPSESFFSAALEQDPSLIEIGVDQNVIIATPVTLIGLLRAISYGWKQEKLSRSAEEIVNLGKVLYKRLIDMQAHMNKLGKSLASSTESYNKMVNSYESRVLVAGRKFQSLGIGVEDDEQPSVLLEQMPKTVKDFKDHCN